MNITITLNTDNAAFEDDPGAEVARILKRLAGELEGVTLDAGDYAKLLDSNGNTVGRYAVTKAPAPIQTSNKRY